ncbi:MAG: hypothetical protein WCD18_01885 [Thermosynechococcaceae cyanobacterium]
MAQTLTIQDETVMGDVIQSFTIQIPTETVTVADLIRERVYQEVAAYNSKQPDQFRGLIQPSDIERQLNRSAPRSFKPIDSEKQYYVALDAFKNNRIIVLVDDKQAEQLEEEVSLTDQSRVSFIRLIPLVGG